MLGLQAHPIAGRHALPLVRKESEVMEYPEVPPGFSKIAIDLDGTIAEKVWPGTHVGALIPEGLDCILHYADLGVEVVILTARPPSHWPRIWGWVQANGLYNVIYDVTNVKTPDMGIIIDDKAWRANWA